MQFFVRVLLAVLTFNIAGAMQSPEAVSEPQPAQVVLLVQKLKEAIATSTDPQKIREIIKEIEGMRSALNKYPQKREAVRRMVLNEKAFLKGHAKARAEIYRKQVDHLIQQNKPIPTQLLNDHMNALINKKQIKYYFESLEK